MPVDVVSMVGPSTTLIQKGSFLQKLILVLTESKRREIAMAEVILELLYPILNAPKTDSNDKENKLVLDENNVDDFMKKKIDEDRPWSVCDFIRRKWEMRTKSKL